MGYEIHIEREGIDDGTNPRGVITLEEWRAAASAVKGVRIAIVKDWVSKNPRTGSEIRITGRNCDAEVYFPANFLQGRFLGKWQKVFRWNPKGKISFRAKLAPDDPDHPVTKAASSLADYLGAALVGDEGEKYQIKQRK